MFSDFFLLLNFKPLECTFPLKFPFYAFELLMFRKKLIKVRESQLFSGTFFLL